MKTIIQSLVSALLIILFLYAAVSKLLIFEAFRGQLYRQAFPSQVAALLLYGLPTSEIIVALLLSFQRTQRIGLFLSIGLLTIFTAYISLVLLHFWDKIPCSCGGIISHMSWATHLVFNGVFILLNLIALVVPSSSNASKPG